MVHRERSLTENLLEFSGMFERHKNLGMQATPDGVAAIAAALQVMTAQAQRAERTVQELTRELVEEASLDTTFGQVRPLEMAGTPSQRLEWMAIESARCAGRLCKADPAELHQIAVWLRYVASTGMALACRLDGEQTVPRAGVTGWVRGVLYGGGT